MPFSERKILLYFSHSALKFLFDIAGIVLHEPDQHISGIHGVPRFHTHLGDHAVHRRGHTAFHFHGFQGDQVLSPGDAVPCCHRHFHHQPGHGARQFIRRQHLFSGGHVPDQVPFFGAVDLVQPVEAAEGDPEKRAVTAQTEPVNPAVDGQLEAAAVEFKVRGHHGHPVLVDPDGPLVSILLFFHPDLIYF